jgi:acylphosphatase
MPRVRRRTFFSGRVQGVGFRARCHVLARGRDIAGYCRNLPEKSEIDAFHAAIELEMSRFITEAATDPEPPNEELQSGFHIRY